MNVTTTATGAKRIIHSNMTVSTGWLGWYKAHTTDAGNIEAANQSNRRHVRMRRVLLAKSFAGASSSSIERGM